MSTPIDVGDWLNTYLTAVTASIHSSCLVQRRRLLRKEINRSVSNTWTCR